MIKNTFFSTIYINWTNYLNQLKLNIIQKDINFYITSSFLKELIFEKLYTYYKLTILFAISFTFFQAWEFIESDLLLTDGYYGSIFYMLTGLHGLHVLVGTIFLSICYYKIFLYSKESISFYLYNDISKNIINKKKSLQNYIQLKNLYFSFKLLNNLKLNKFVNVPRNGLFSAIWYWHFVDVIWIFLFLTLYLIS